MLIYIINKTTNQAPIPYARFRYNIIKNAHTDNEA